MKKTLRMFYIVVVAAVIGLGIGGLAILSAPTPAEAKRGAELRQEREVRERNRRERREYIEKYGTDQERYERQARQLQEDGRRMAWAAEHARLRRMGYSDAEASHLLDR